MNRPIFLILVVALCVIAAGGYHYFSPRVRVETAIVEMGTIHAYVDERARTRLPRIHLITMPYDGRIQEIPLEEGSRVARGQVVARIVEPDLDVALARARATVARLKAAIVENDDATVETTLHRQAVNFVVAMDETVKAAAERMKAGQAKHEYAVKNLDRVAALARSGAKTESDLDRASVAEVESGVDYQTDKLVYNAMQALQAATALVPTSVQQKIDRKALSGAVLAKELAEAEANLEQAEADHTRGIMASPVDGVVLERLVTNQRTLAAGTVLLKISRLEELEIEAELLSQDAVAVRPGDPVEIYGAAIGSGGAKGQVSRVYPAGFTKISSLGVEQQRVLVIIRFAEGERARLATSRPLGVDYRVRVRVITETRDNTRHVPRSAVFRAPGGQWQLLVVRSGKAVRQDIEVGLMNDQRVEITGGVEAGQVVILAPESHLTDGTRVATSSGPRTTP